MDSQTIVLTAAVIVLGLATWQLYRYNKSTLKPKDKWNRLFDALENIDTNGFLETRDQPPAQQRNLFKKKQSNAEG